MKHIHSESNNKNIWSALNKVPSRNVGSKLIFTAIMLLGLPAWLLSTNVRSQDPKPETKQEPKQEVKVETPKILAVEFYADWCAVCKVLMPRMAEAKNDLQGKSVLFVRFDMTNDFTKEQASYLAGFSGLQDVYRRGRGKTGMVALVDAKTKNVLGVISQKKSLDEIKAMFSDAISKASAN